MTYRNIFLFIPRNGFFVSFLRDFSFYLIPKSYINYLDFQSFNTVGSNFSILRRFEFCILIFRPYLCNFNFYKLQRTNYEHDKRQQTAC